MFSSRQNDYCEESLPKMAANGQVVKGGEWHSTAQGGLIHIQISCARDNTQSLSWLSNLRPAPFKATPSLAGCEI